jgi:hypothetical protein
LRNAHGEDDPRPFPPELVIEVKALACELPSRLGLPLSRLQVSDIRSEVITRGLTAEISGTTIWRWLAEDAIRPWAHRSWIFPRAPDFEPTAALAAVEQRLLAFQRRYEQAATPFEWKFTCADLALLMKRLAEKDDQPKGRRAERNT